MAHTYKHVRMYKYNDDGADPMIATVKRLQKGDVFYIFYDGSGCCFARTVDDLPNDAAPFITDAMREQRFN